MKNCIETELWKALHNRLFLLSIAIGLVLCATHVVQAAIDNAALAARILYWKNVPDQNAGYEGLSLFIYWMGVDDIRYASRLFYFIWPILAALPFGWSYAQERRDGVYAQIAIRCGKREYYIAKYIAVFVSGALVVAIPVLLDLLILAMICPAPVTSIMLDFGVPNQYFQSALYHTYPWAYALLWCGVELLWGGTAACLCFVIGHWIRFQFLTVLFPFVAFFVADSFCNVLRGTIDNLWGLELSPLQLIQAAPSTGANPEWLVFTELGILVAVSFAVGYWQVVKHELV